MKKKLLHLFIILSVISSGLLVCTISDDNGSPSVTGPDDNNNGNINPKDTVYYLGIQNISPTKSGDTAIVNAYLFSDSANTKTVAGANIMVSSSVTGVYLSNDTLITSNHGLITFKISYTLPSGISESNIPLTFNFNNQSAGTSITFSEEPTTLNQNFMVISASPYNIKADGSSQSQVSVKIKNENFNPIVGETILFKTNAGDITASSISNENGIATAFLTSEKRNDTANITATMLTDTSKNIQVQVEFTGVGISTSLSKESISPNNIDSSILTITLQDANEENIYGERVYFSTTSSSAAIITTIDTITNTRGQASCKIKASPTTNTSDTIIIRSAGDSVSAIINYSENVLKISVDSSSLIANGKDSTLITITFLGSDSITPIVNSTINASITSGTIGSGVDTTSSYTGTSNGSGEVSFYLNNPDFATTVTITANASSGTSVTSSTFGVYFRSSVIKQIVLSGSPEVIETDGDKATIKAVCFDSSGNRVNNETVTFRIVDGPGAGEYLDPPVAKTDLSGVATVNLYSGTEESKQQEVKIVASSYSGVESNISFFTIAGAPAYITFRKNVGEISDNDDGTYTKNGSALVTDINSNPVKDSTIVTFSSQIIGYIIYKKIANFSDYKYTIGDTPVILEFDDHNNNYVYDDGENSYGGYPLKRGEDLVWFAGDNTYEPGPTYYDINCNGRRDWDTNSIFYEKPEPCTTIAFPVLDSLGDTVSWKDSLIFADFNGNGQLDIFEPLISYSYTSSTGDTAGGYMEDSLHYANFNPSAYNYSLYGGYPDYDWSNNKIPDPSTTVIINRNVPTKDGIAPNFITYGQSDALRIKIRVWAESKGLVSESKEEFILPILLEDAQYFDPLDGKKYK